ncbi:protein phosphatase 2C domain-containing protein [Herbivorax sp. ANBcel31]|uniref:PP2C family protein-serine/threonine phosphatase n=1 Tax=Herbivorax sp. ANBcel31 TaxID=3069754 RepID=UPI0027B54C81|nr:protein phosphatase 2C domain-containing protein [Herbivorax sp. ANBcel31]MDQ2085704.1 protein phosphatase 2C domain-containing protein [Herbivorax sp. ANBcel31]
MNNFNVGAICDTGNIKKINQDNLLVKIGETHFGEFGLFVIADGMGGLSAGEVASSIIVSNFKKWWEKDLSALINTDNFNLHLIDIGLKKLIQAINQNILDYGTSIKESVGSTLSMLFLYNNSYLIKHIGDSRIYLINKNITKLTKDHSWVAQLVREGKLTWKQAKNHPKRNVLTKCMGVSNDIDLYELKGSIMETDNFLLCSDGFYNYLDEQEILKYIQKCKGSNNHVQEYLSSMLKKIKSKKAHDNISAIAVLQHHQKPNGKRHFLFRQ